MDGEAAARRGLAGAGIAVVVLLVLGGVVTGGLVVLAQAFGPAAEDDPGSVLLGTVDDIRGSTVFTVAPFDGVAPQEWTGAGITPELRASVPASTDRTTEVLDAAVALGVAGIDWTDATCRRDLQTGDLEVELDGFDDLPVGPSPVDLGTGRDGDTVDVVVSVPTVDGAAGAGNEGALEPSPDCPAVHLERLQSLLAAR